MFLAALRDTSLKHGRVHTLCKINSKRAQRRCTSILAGISSKRELFQQLRWMIVDNSSFDSRPKFNILLDTNY